MRALAPAMMAAMMGGIGMPMGRAVTYGGQAAQTSEAIALRKTRRGSQRGSQREQDRRVDAANEKRARKGRRSFR